MKRFCWLVVMVFLGIFAFQFQLWAQEIVLMHDKGGAPDWQTLFTEMARICAEELGIAFTPTPFPTTDVFMSAVRTALPTGKAPELFTWWSDFRMKPLVDTGLVEDVTALWEKHRDEYDLAFKDAFEFDGKVYGVPTNLAYWVVYYSVPVFQKFGLEEPKTWEEFIKICDVLKANGIVPLGSTVQGRWPTFIYFEDLMIRTNPDVYIDLMVGKAKYTDEPVKRVFTLWREMIEKGYFSDPATDIFADYPRLMAQGKAGMILIGNWYEGQLIQMGLTVGKDVGAFILPSIDPKVGKVIIYEAAPMLLGKNAPGKEKALQIADWWLSPETQYKWCKLMGFVPANKKTSADFLSVPMQNIVKQVAQENYRLINRFWEATPTDICEEAVDKFAEFILNPGKMEQILGDLQKVADTYWSSH
ncbi:MAG: extracellular solute-binding protein [Atribacterota bacterium]